MYIIYLYKQVSPPCNEQALLAHVVIANTDKNRTVIGETIEETLQNVNFTYSLVCWSPGEF